MLGICSKRCLGRRFRALRQTTRYWRHLPGSMGRRWHPRTWVFAGSLLCRGSIRWLEKPEVGLVPRRAICGGGKPSGRGSMPRLLGPGSGGLRPDSPSSSFCSAIPNLGTGGEAELGRLTNLKGFGCAARSPAAIDSRKAFPVACQDFDNREERPGHPTFELKPAPGVLFI